MSENKIKEIMEDLPNHFNKELSKGIDAKVQFNLSGPESGEWGMEIKDQTCSITQGIIQQPSLILKSDGELLTKVLKGEEDGVRAYMMGKLKLIGDINLALKLVNLFQ